MSEKLICLGVVNRQRAIYIPWRGTTIFPQHEYEPGQTLLVTLEINEAGNGESVNIELPTLELLVKMRQELESDWTRMAKIFESYPMWRKVELLRALDRKIGELNARADRS